MSAYLEEIEDKSTTSIIQLVMKGLSKKYSTAFHFYQVKPINDILHANYDSPASIQLHDLRVFSEDTEFLRRVYFYRTLTGRPQIDHRIKLCADFYSQVLPLAHHYPMMIITNTKSLFLKRNHRLRKIQAGEGSSDETQRQGEPLEQFHETSSCEFLEELENSSLEEDKAEEESMADYDSSEHDVFEEDQIQKQPESLFQLKTIDQGTLGHLISDFSEKIAKQECQSTAECISKPALATIDNRPFSEKSLAVTSISNIKFAHQYRKSHISKYLDILQDSRKNILSGFIQGLENVSVSEQAKKASLQPCMVSSLQGNHPERTQLENKRRRIRQKAQQLLRRAKNDLQEGNALYE